MLIEGFGNWLFKMTGTDNRGRFTEFTGNATGKFGEVKKQVIRQFKQEVGGVKKIVEIVVMP